MIEDKAPAAIVETANGERPAAVQNPVTGPEVTETENTKAKRLFLRRVQDVPGVVHVELFGGQVIGEQSFIVYVRDGDIAAEYGVYAVEREVYGQYPAVSLHVDLLEQSDLPENGVGAAAPSG